MTIGYMQREDTITITSLTLYDGHLQIVLSDGYDFIVHLTDVSFVLSRMLPHLAERWTLTDSGIRWPDINLDVFVIDLLYIKGQWATDLPHYDNPGKAVKQVEWWADHVEDTRQKDVGK